MFNHRCGSKVGGTFRACASLLRDQERIKLFMERLTQRLEMNDLVTVVYDVANELRKCGQPIEADEGGVTSVTVYTTSHGAIHTWPEEGAATFDIHSCRPFKLVAVREVIQEIFDTDDIDIFDLSFSLKEKKPRAAIQEEYLFFDAEGSS